MAKNSKFIIVVVILLIAAALNYYFAKPDVVLPRKNLSEFPKTLGDWTMVSEHQIDDQSMKILQVDDYLMRDYRNTEGNVIGLYIGYFKSQREGKGIHSPRQCLPGAGWVPVNAEVYQLSVPGQSPNTFKVNKYIIGKGLDRELYLFWYCGRNRNYASEYWNKIYLIWDAMTKKRTDGALVRINNSIIRSNEESLKAQTEFIRLFSPILKEYIPE